MRLKVCPDIITVPAQFDFCLSATRQLKMLFESLAPRVDIFSLDEAFIDLSDCQDFYPDAQVFAELVQRRIKDTLGDWVTCNVGISHTRLLAKMTSEVSPKGSITEVTEDNKNALLASVPFAAVCGVGYRLEERLKVLGVTNPFQINFIPDDELLRHFGPFWSHELRKIGRGEETHFFMHPPRVNHMQSIGRSITGYKLCDDEETIKKTLCNLTEEVIYKARRMKLAGRVVSLSLRGHDDGHWGQQLRTDHPICHTSDMFNVLYDQMYKKWQRTFSIIKIHITLSALQPWEHTPQVLWADWHQRERVSVAVDELTQKYGLFTVRSGVLLNTKLLRPEVTGFLGDKAFQFGRIS